MERRDDNAGWYHETNAMCEAEIRRCKRHEAAPNEVNFTIYLDFSLHVPVFTRRRLDDSPATSIVANLLLPAQAFRVSKQTDGPSRLVVVAGLIRNGHFPFFGQFVRMIYPLCRMIWFIQTQRIVFRLIALHARSR